MAEEYGVSIDTEGASKASTKIVASMTRGNRGAPIHAPPSTFRSICVIANEERVCPGPVIS